MEHRILYINFLLMIWVWRVGTIVIYTLGSNCNLALGSQCPGFLNSECDSQGKCLCRHPDYYFNTNYSSCQERKRYGSFCRQSECSLGLICEYRQSNLGDFCVCPHRQFCYPKGSGMCRNEATLRADNLHLNGPPNETELSLAWDRPLNVSDPLTYRMVINGTEEITPINETMYTLTNRQPGTPYQIQIYTSTFKDSGVTDVKIENNNPLHGTFCTKPAVPGSLVTKIYSNSTVTLQFFKSDGRVESYNVTVTEPAVPGSLATNTFPTPPVTFTSQSSESEGLVTWVEMNGTTIIEPAVPGSLATNTFPTPPVTFTSQSSESEGLVTWVEMNGTTIIEPAVPGSLATNTFPTPPVTFTSQSSESEGLFTWVEMNGTTIIDKPIEKPATGAIVGGVVGGLCFVVIVVIVIYKKRARMTKISPF